MKSRLLVLGIMASLLLGAVPVAEAQNESAVVAVFMMESRGSGLKADEVVNLTDYMSTRMGEGGQLQIIPRDEIKKRLVQAKASSHKECYDTDCQIQLGRELAAQFSVNSSIGRVGQRCLISVNVFDLKTSTSIVALTGNGKCDPDTLIASIDMLAVDVREKIVSHLAKIAQVTVVPAEKPPVVEPDPIVEKPVAPPPPVEEERSVVKVAAGEKLPRFFLGAGLGATSITTIEYNYELDPLVGFAGSADWRIGKGFMLGVGLSLEFSEAQNNLPLGYFDLTIRLGYLIPLMSESLLLHPYFVLGLGQIISTEDDTNPNSTEWTGGLVGLGFGVRWMFLSWLGLSADLGFEYGNWIAYFDAGDSSIEESLETTNVKFQLGLVFGF